MKEKILYEKVKLSKEQKKQIINLLCGSYKENRRGIKLLVDFKRKYKKQTEHQKHLSNNLK